MIHKAKKKKVENNFNKMLVDLLLQCTCWAQFNIYLVFKHTPLDSKLLIAIIHYAFENSNVDFDKWFVDQTVLKQHETLRINS